MEPLSFLALGDSYTIGEGLRAAERWPVQLADRLRARGIPIFPPRVIARTGWSTEDLATALDRARLKPRYDLVSLSIGVNDQYRDQALAGYRERFAGLLDRAVALASGTTERVVVPSIPDWSVTPFAREDPRGAARLAAKLEEFNGAMREVAAARRVVYVDITPSTRDMGADPELVADDGLHPSATLYGRWADRIAESIRGMPTRS